MFNKVYFVTPMYNASYHLDSLYESLKEQSNPNWVWVILDDQSSDDSNERASKIVDSDTLGRVMITRCSKNEKKFALKNLCDFLDGMRERGQVSKDMFDQDDYIVAVVDGDDELCNENTVELILSEYNGNEKLDALWTAHTWDVNSLNISRELPQKINTYQYPWVSSHLKTFKLSVFENISNENFKDLDGNWFKRGYDQALYLPILYLAREHMYMNEICYLYRINSNSIQNREAKEKEQMDTVRLVRARGYVK
tara:strand:- start:13019 stop:13777 length:759 start_codon:yes stop_codon:yes gene_type:complete